MQVGASRILMIDTNLLEATLIICTSVVAYNICHLYIRWHILPSSQDIWVLLRHVCTCGLPHWLMQRACMPGYLYRTKPLICMQAASARVVWANLLRTGTVYRGCLDKSALNVLVQRQASRHLAIHNKHGLGMQIPMAICADSGRLAASQQCCAMVVQMWDP